LTIKTHLIHNKEIKKRVLKIYTSFYLVDCVPFTVIRKKVFFKLIITA